jgi:hypothetical protein
MLALFNAGLSSGCRSAGLNKEIAKKSALDKQLSS